MMTQDDLDRDWLAEQEHRDHDTPNPECDLCPEVGEETQ